MQVLRLDSNAQLPFRASAGAAGYDLSTLHEVCLEPWSSGRCATGLAIAIPDGCYGRVAPRSSLALRGIMTMAGVIDSDYRGELQVLLINLSDQRVVLTAGERCAQLIIERIEVPVVEEVSQLPATARDRGGFGSTN